MCSARAILTVFFALALPLWGNDTALNEGAYGPQPVGGIDGPESVIRMQSEELHIAFGKHWTGVYARFVFRNTTDAPVDQMVGFPDIGAAQQESFRRHRSKDERVSAFNMGGPVAGELVHMRTFVNGDEQKSELRYGWVKKVDGIDTPVEERDKNSLLMAWHALKVTFPPKQDVIVERRYSTASGYEVMGVYFFEYTTATGGVWQGTIGRLEAYVTLEDGITVDDLAWPGEKLPKFQTDESRLLTDPARDQWQILSPTRLRLVWEDFEPRTERNRRRFEVATQSYRLREKGE